MIATRNYTILNCVVTIVIGNSEMVFVLLDWSNRSDLSRHVMWANRSKTLTSSFDGVPYVVLGRRTMECRYGRDRHRTVKEAKKKSLPVICFICFVIPITIPTLFCNVV